MDEPQVHDAKSGDVHIAYQVVGCGDPEARRVTERLIRDAGYEPVAADFADRVDVGGCFSTGRVAFSLVRSLARGVTAARLTLDQLVLVRIQAGQRTAEPRRYADANSVSFSPSFPASTWT